MDATRPGPSRVSPDDFGDEFDRLVGWSTTKLVALLYIGSSRQANPARPIGCDRGRLDR
jgi:hypothetical protein